MKMSRTVRLKRYLIHLFFPNRCPFCGKVMEANLHSCEECSDKLVFLDYSLCSYCNREECSCPAGTLGVDRAVSAFLYEDPVRQAVLNFKFQGRSQYAEHLGWYMAEALRLQGLVTELDCIAYVPMTGKKKKSRGYNQAELLARVLSRETGLPLVHALKKVKDTGEQHALSARQRHYNLIGAYDVSDPKAVEGRRVLLADDVLTTGGTVHECNNILRYYGAQKVYTATICRVRQETGG